MSLLIPLLSVIWIGMHWELGRRRFRRTLGIVIATEMAIFAALGVYLKNEVERHPTGAMAAGIFLYAGIFLLLFPSLLGGVALLKYRRMGFEQEQDTN